jgi:NADPH:quinone reductase-like Zn-dependent oxidoreductase
MKAVVCTRYGSPDVLQLREIDRPVPRGDEALVRIHAASLNAVDHETLRGVLLVRMTSPFRPPHRVLGTDIAGQVEAVGSSAGHFRPGDTVWADLSEHGWGALAEYVCVTEDALRPKPAGMTFEEAAAYPQAAILALQNLQGTGKPPSTPMLLDKGPIVPGQRVLINGAGGGVGTFAVQLAKHFGAEVTGVDAAGKLDMLRSIGADHVIDYAEEDFTRNGRNYDLIVDVVARRPISAYKRSLSPNGVCVLVGGTAAAIFQAVLLGSLTSRRSGKRLGVVMWKPNRREDLDLLSRLFEAGKVRPVVDRTYPLEEAPEALGYLEEGRALGKVVITMTHPSETGRTADVS